MTGGPGTHPSRPPIGPRDAALVAALAIQRGLELLRSRRLAVRRAGAGSGAPAAPRSYPVMVAVHLALFIWPIRSRWRRPRPPLSVRVASAALLLAATGLRLWAIRALGPSWDVQARVPPDLVPVRLGPYRHVRHPNYLAVAAEFVALPAFLGAYRAALVLSAADAAVLAPRIRGEERLLDANSAYRAAFLGVPRFIPTLGRRTPAAPPPA